MIYDITPPVSSETEVWPGEPKLKQEYVANLNDGDSVTVSILHTTVHIGAHADAPSHIVQNSHSIGEVCLVPYLGRCQVIQPDGHVAGLITLSNITEQIVAERVLIKTNSYYPNTSFVKNFIALAPELIDHLKDRGVILVGIDTPSVDPFDSKTLEAHKRLVKYDIAILEGIDLTQVPEGIFELIALPLKLVGFDASPVRAILRGLEKQ